MLAGNLASIGVGGIVAVAWSLWVGVILDEFVLTRCLRLTSLLVTGSCRLRF